MSRPVGRYFASVIGKIQAYKLKENIVVDQNLKMDLRSALLAKIQSGDLSSSVSEEAPLYVSKVVEDETPGIFDRFFKWRYQVALIPVFLFAVVAVSALRRWPIDFKTKAPAPQVQTPVVDTVAPQTLEPTPMPTPAQASTPVAETVPATLPTPEPQYATSAPAIVPFIEPKTPQQSSKIVAPQPSNTDAVNKSDATTNNPSELSYSMVVEPSPVVAPTPSASTTVVPSVEAPMSNTVLPPSSPVYVAPALNAPASSVPLSDTQTSGTDVKAPGYRVSYGGTFSSEDKALFERKFLPYLAEGKDVAYFFVRLEKPKSIFVTMYLKDRTSTISHFFYDDVLKTWSFDRSYR